MGSIVSPMMVMSEEAGDTDLFTDFAKVGRQHHDDDFVGRTSLPGNSLLPFLVLESH